MLMKEFSEEDELDRVQVYDAEINALNFNHVKNSKVFDASKIEISDSFIDDSLSTWMSQNSNGNNKLFHSNDNLF